MVIENNQSPTFWDILELHYITKKEINNKPQIVKFLETLYSYKDKLPLNLKLELSLSNYLNEDVYTTRFLIEDNDDCTIALFVVRFHKETIYPLEIAYDSKKIVYKTKTGFERNLDRLFENNFKKMLDASN